jgi:SAM-dependent methyltransferase
MSDPIGLRRREIFQQLLGLFRPGRLVDLGAGHGLFAIDSTRTGWQVVAVDARTERNTAAPSVEWIESDIRSFQLDGFDVIACLGLFYHLTVEDQVDLLRRSSGTPIIIDTHLANGLSSHPLSETVELDGYRGRIFGEEEGYASSWGNASSFWPEPDSFYKMLDDMGYDVVATVEPWYQPDRTFFLALPARPSPIR